MNKYIAICGFMIIAALGACKKNTGSKVPYISEVSVEPTTVVAGSNKDSVFISFKLEDGDGDLGHDANSGLYDIYLRDKRFDTVVIKFFFPKIPDDIKDGKKGIEGHCTISVNAAFLQLRPDHPELDTLQYEIYITDLAGNESNRLDTWDIYLLKP